MKKLSLVMTSLVLIGWLSSGTAQAQNNPNDLLIVANKSVKRSSVTAAELRMYFLKKRSNWKGGGRVVPINAPRHSNLRKAFQARVLKMLDSEEEEYWKNEQIRRGVRKPAELQRTLKAVYHIRGSVSYVFRKNYKANVAVILAVF